VPNQKNFEALAEKVILLERINNQKTYLEWHQRTKLWQTLREQAIGRFVAEGTFGIC